MAGMFRKRSGRVKGTAMILDISKVRIFIRPGHTDLRKASNGLAVIVQEEMKGDPFSGNVYLFCNRERNLLKAVYWDKTGCVPFGYDGFARKGLRKKNTPGLRQEGKRRNLTAGNCECF